MTAAATELTIWGASGSAPVANRNRCDYGGDTTCFGLWRGGDHHLLIDAGTGARSAGAMICEHARKTGRRAEVDILLSHLHQDHLLGLTVFEPLYVDIAAVRFHCGVVADDEELHRMVRTLFSPPFYPLAPESWCDVSFHHLPTGERRRFGDYEVLCFEVNHPGGCRGFRIEAPDGVLAVVGDHEHGDPRIDGIVSRAVAGADVMIYDAAYDDETYARRKGWGHSTWSAGVGLARRAGVGRTLLHHHDPDITDEQLEERDAAIAAVEPRAALARQGAALRLAG